MGFNQCYIGHIDGIKKELETRGVEDFCKMYMKYDAVFGDSNSIEFIRQTIKKHMEEKTDEMYQITKSN